MIKKYKLFEYFTSLIHGDNIKLITNNKNATFLKWQNNNKTKAVIEYPDGDKDIVNTNDIEYDEINTVELLFDYLDADDILDFKITKTKDGKELIKIQNKLIDDPNYGDRPRYHKSEKVIRNYPENKMYLIVIPLETGDFKTSFYKGTIDNPIKPIESKLDYNIIDVHSIMFILNLLKDLNTYVYNPEIDREEILTSSKIVNKINNLL